MIRYALACDRHHSFESWFASSEAFDEQSARGLVECPVCGSANVAKQLMAPSVSRSDKPQPAVPASPVIAEQATAPQQTQPVALLSEPERQIRAMLREIREHVLRTADDVGREFASEARKMHYGDVEQRSIYGQTTPDEAASLLEEGIEVHPLPFAPEDRN